MLLIFSTALSGSAQIKAGSELATVLTPAAILEDTFPEATRPFTGEKYLSGTLVHEENLFSFPLKGNITK